MSLKIAASKVKKAKTVAKKAAGGGKTGASRLKRNPAMSVDGYLAGLPAERRNVVAGLRNLILKHLPKGYAESMGYGMICYGVPLAAYPDTYNGQPLCYLALASQKNYLALYAMSLYGDPGKLRQFREDFASAGKKLDMGKSCIRFRTLDDLPLPVIRRMVADTSVEEFIAAYERSRRKA